MELLHAALGMAAHDRHHGDPDAMAQQVERWLREARPVALRILAERHAMAAMEAAAQAAIRSGLVH